ncbi:MAG TPA: type II TA system antitoxin MqsA family protein [Verrucomicrobiae bacterium]|jgi:putative zinc finger/helix-turn-helix YgiT family protein|nr:type II TA system antitoxin MqsA family protein [Verrucomicrobiae bacterium]
MYCLSCNNEKFTEKLQAIPQVFREECFSVVAPAMVCDHCGWVTMTDFQADNLCLVTADEYRRRHGLLTGAEIVALRKAFNMSQSKFADYIGAGEASVKRWENGAVQEPIYDERIRSKCFPTPVRIMWGATIVSLPQFVPQFEITDAIGPVAEHPRQLSVRPPVGQTDDSTFRIRLSDGNSYRSDHFISDDPLFSAAA